MSLVPFWQQIYYEVFEGPKGLAMKKSNNDPPLADKQQENEPGNTGYVSG
jgi:hypothetical protein